MKTIIYRADDYENDFGNLVGFFGSMEKAKQEIEYSNPVRLGYGNFSQITAFEIEYDKVKDVDISNNKLMLSDEIWGSGEITDTFYFK